MRYEEWRQMTSQACAIHFASSPDDALPVLEEYLLIQHITGMRLLNLRNELYTAYTQHVFPSWWRLQCTYEHIDEYAKCLLGIDAPVYYELPDP